MGMIKDLDDRLPQISEDERYRLYRYFKQAENDHASRKAVEGYMGYTMDDLSLLNHANEVYLTLSPAEQLRADNDTDFIFSPLELARMRAGKTRREAAEEKGITSDQVQEYENSNLLHHRSNGDSYKVLQAQAENQWKLERISDHYQLVVYNPVMRPDGLAWDYSHQVGWPPKTMKHDQGPQILADDDSKPRLFVDMDGTLAEFKVCDSLEQLYEPGYFLNLKPQENVVEAVKLLAKSPEVKVYILSAYLTDSPTALEEKNLWLDEHLPELNYTHRLFIPCGQDKSSIASVIRPTDILLDDYTKNLIQWTKAGGRAVKLLNGINHRRGTWRGEMVSKEDVPVSLCQALIGGTRAVSQGIQFPEPLMP